MVDFFGGNYTGEKPGSQLIATSSKLPAKYFTTSLDESKATAGKVIDQIEGWRYRRVRHLQCAMSDYKKLQVWRKAHALALNAHRAANRIRGSQYSSFRSQIIRAAMSIPSNIVEGREQETEAAFARFLKIALASASELDYHLLAARELAPLPKGSTCRYRVRLWR